MPNCYDDIASVLSFNSSDQLKRIWVDSLVHDEDALLLLIKKFGYDKIILGTDYPFPLGELEPGKLIEEIDLESFAGKHSESEIKKKMLGLNAIKFLRMDELSNGATI